LHGDRDHPDIAATLHALGNLSIKQHKEIAAGLKATLKDSKRFAKKPGPDYTENLAKGVSDEDDEEKCRRAAEFVEEVFSEFKRMH
jgi:hypothetical protein